MTKFIKFKRALSKLQILPSWIIFLLDIAILTITSRTSYYLFSTLNIQFSPEYSFTFRISILLAVYTSFFLVFKTYKGIIRYSTLTDIGKVFNAVFFSFITLITIHFVNYLFTGKSIFILFTLFYSSIFIFSSLIGFRILVKLIFQKFLKTNTTIEKENIVIIGVNATTISLVESLNSTNSPFKLIAFIDINDNLNGKKIAGINVLSFSKRPIITYLKLKNVKNIILVKDYLPDDQENKLIENCIHNEIKVFKPEIVVNEDTLNDKLKSYKLEELLFRETIEINNTQVFQSFKNKKVVITGGAGSIGSELAKQLSQFEPEKIIIVDNSETPLFEIENFFKKNMPNCNCFFELVDVTNYEELNGVFDKHKPDVIFHAAAYKHVPMLERNYRQAIKVNIFGTKNCLELALQYKVENFVFISTDKAVNPTNIMGASKRFAEMLCQSTFTCVKNQHNMQILSTRFGNVLGSNGSVVTLFKKQIKAGGPVTVTHPDVTRFFMTIPEACRLVIEAGAMGQGGQTYLFDMGKSIRIVDLAEKMILLAGKKPNKDIKITFTGLREGEKLYEEVLTDSATTLPTYHPKIVIAKEENPSIEKLEEITLHFQRLNQLERNDIIAQFKDIIPGFKPYESI